MSNPNTRKSCVVPKCTNTTTNSPDKLFFIVPNDVKMRKKWIEAMKRLDPFGDKSTVYCCEDHFDIENDMQSYIKYKMVGGNIKLKKGIIPHKFNCQEVKKVKHDKSAVQKRNQIKYFEKPSNEEETSAFEKPEEIIVARCEDERLIKDPMNFGSTKMPKKETNLQRKRRLIKSKNIRLKKLENETPEERQERLKKKRENARKCREKRELLKTKEQCDTHFELQPNCMPQDNGLLKVRSVTIQKEMNIFTDQICEQTKMPLCFPSSSNTADLQTETVIKQENDMDHTIDEESVDIKTEITTDDGVTTENTDNLFQDDQLQIKQEHISLSLEKESTGSDTEDSQSRMDEYNDQKDEMQHYATVPKFEIDCDGSEVKEETVMRDESLVTYDYPNFDDVGSMDSNEASALTHVEACLQEEINIKSEDDAHDMNNTLEQKENSSLTTRKRGRPRKRKPGRPKTSDKSRKEQLREANERYKKAHPEAVKNAQKRYAEKNREAHRKAVKLYAEKHPEVNRKAVKRYREKNPEVNRRAVKRYAEKNPEVNRRAVKRYREKIREEKRKAAMRYAETYPEEKEEYNKVNIKEETDLTVTETHLISNKLINTTSTITHPHDGVIESNTTKTLVMEILPMTRTNMTFSKLGNPEEILPTTYNNSEDYMDYQDSFQLNSITGNILSLEQEAYGLLKTKGKKKDLGDALITCPKCPKTYRQKTCLKRHLTVHDSIEKREQGLQRSLVTKKKNRKKKAELESEVIKKEEKKEIKKEGYECTCGQIFQRRSRMETCLRSHNLFSDTDTYPCVSCSKQFKDKEELALHRKRLHRKRFPCKFCPTDYHTRKELFKHLQIHQKVQLMEYKVISEVVKGKQKLKCFMCSKSYMELSDLKCHVMDDHKEPYSCPRCKRTFSKIIDFGNHTKTFHPEVEGQSVLDVLEAFSKLVKAWKCEECGLQFHEADKLAMHQIEKHSPDVKAETQFQCTDCRRVFVSQKGLTSHRRIHHSTETVEESEIIEKGVMCLECRKICKDMNALLSHMRLHSPDRKYPCKFCDFRFATPEKRKAHAEIHTGDMRYVCFICEYQCSSENRLKQHKLSPKHINMKEFLLTGKPLVEEASSSKETLKKKEVVKEKKKRDKSKSVSESECSEVACDICGDKFPSESEMQEHKQTHPFIEFPNEDTPSRIFFK